MAIIIVLPWCSNIFTDDTGTVASRSALSGGSLNGELPTTLNEDEEAETGSTIEADIASQRSEIESLRSFASSESLLTHIPHPMC